MNKTYVVFTEIISFINEITKRREKISKLKIKNSINSTSFHKLKNNEKKFGFSESLNQKKIINKFHFSF